MEEEKKAEGETTKSAPVPIITRSMEESMQEGCEGPCGTEEPKIPENLPDPNWSTEKLIEALNDKHMLVRSNAVMLLSKREPEKVTEPLIQALKDDDYVVKSNAMVALASFGKSLVDRMISALSDPEPGIRAGAAWILGEFKDSKSIEPLEKAAKDENPLVRIQAKASLQAMGRWPKKEGKKEEKPQEKEEKTQEKKE